jgi:nucleotide-binding universal stress UspA family protein
MIAPARTRPLPTSPGRIGRVLLATDLTDTSGPATDEAIRLAAATGATLLAVSVIDPGALRLPGGRFRERVDQVRTRREAAAQELVALGQRHGVAVRFLIWQGEPGPSVLEAAEAEDVDVVVVGSHGRGAVSAASSWAASRSISFGTPAGRSWSSARTSARATTSRPAPAAQPTSSTDAAPPASDRPRARQAAGPRRACPSDSHDGPDGTSAPNGVVATVTPSGSMNGWPSRRPDRLEEPRNEVR